VGVRHSAAVAPAASLHVSDAPNGVISLTDGVIVPSKSVVGVITIPVVALNRCWVLLVLDTAVIVIPPTVMVTDPAVLPVIV
jgi:hypothetical protein